MLAALAIHAGRPVPIDTLVDWIWTEEAPAPQNPTGALYTYATRVRRALRQLDMPVALISENGSYRLDCPRLRVDYYIFQNLITKARGLRRQGGAEDAAHVVRQAFRLWRGRPLDELRTDRANNWRRRVEIDEWLPANAMLLELMIELGQLEDALVRLNDLQADHPDDLNLAKLRLAALHRLARPEVTTYYQHTRRRLLEDADEQAADHLSTFFESLGISRQPRRIDAIRAGSPVVPHQLPHDTTPFVGREALLNTLDATFAMDTSEPKPGVVVLDGMPGVGKTALAVRWGHLVRDRFPDGNLYLDLRGFADEPKLAQSTVVDTLLGALGHSIDAGTRPPSRAARLSNVLTGKRTLVVLDNARDSEHVADLIPLLASCVVVVTSRQQLTKLKAWKGAQRLRVEPMPPDESTTLLARRLGRQEASPGADLADLAALGGGIPLAINLIAEHVAARPGARISDLSARLRGDRALLTIGEDGDTVASLRALFAYSYRALAAPEQRLFRLLGCHPGPDLSEEVASAIDGRSDAETRRSLNMLVGAHLLNQPEVGRFRFHDLLSEYALDVASHEAPLSEVDAAERRFLSFYLTSACSADRRMFPSHSTPPQLPVEEHVTPLEFPNADLAMAWCIKENLNLDMALRYAARHGHDVYAWRLAQATAAAVERRGLYEQSRAAWLIAVEAARRCGDAAAETASWQQLGLAHLPLNDFAQARECLRRALRMAEDNQDLDNQAYALHSLGRLEVAQGNGTAGIQLYQRCLDVARRTGNPDIECWTLYRIGDALRGQAKYDEALLQLHHAQWLAATIGDASAQASILTGLGSVFARQGEYGTGAAYFGQSLKIVKSIRYVAAAAQLCTEWAELERARGAFLDACRFARQSVSLHRRINNSEGLANALELLADVLFELGNIAAAVEGWEQSAELFRNLETPARAELIHSKLSRSNI